MANRFSQHFEVLIPGLEISQLATPVASFTSTTTPTQTILTGKTAPVGSLVTIHVAAQQVVTGVSDSKGNTYTVNRSDSNGTIVDTSVASSVITTALVAGDVITITLAAASIRTCISTYCWSGFIWSGIDQVSGGSGTGTAVSGGTTGTTTKPDEIALFLLGLSSALVNVPPPTGYSRVATDLSSGGGTPTGLNVYYKRLATTGTESPAVTLGSSQNWAASTATYGMLIPVEAVDSATIPVTITFSAGEVFTGSTAYVDSGTVYVDVQPSTVDVLAAVEAVACSVTVTPSWAEVPPATGNVDAANFYVDVDPSASLEVKAKEYGDSGNFYADVTMDLHECFNHPTPNWVVIEMKRWDVAEQIQRWLVASENKHWDVFEVVGAFDNTC